MEKWLMIVQLGQYERYYMVRKDKLDEVGDVVSKLSDEYEKTYPPMKVEEYVENGLETIFGKEIVEPIKIGMKIIRMIEI